jgi:hypothetical protein
MKACRRKEVLQFCSSAVLQFCIQLSKVSPYSLLLTPYSSLTSHLSPLTSYLFYQQVIPKGISPPRPSSLVTYTGPHKPGTPGNPTPPDPFRKHPRHSV